MPVSLTAHGEVMPAWVTTPTARRDGQAAINRAFWQAVIDAARVDDADRPLPRHGGNDRIRLAFPSPVDTATIDRSWSGAGVLFRRT